MEHRRLAKGCRADDHVTDCRFILGGLVMFLALHPASTGSRLFSFISFSEKRKS